MKLIIATRRVSSPSWLLAALAFSLAGIASAEELPSACPILSSQQVSTILGRDIPSGGVAASRKGKTATCKFKGESQLAEVRVSEFPTEAAAIDSYRETLANFSREAARSEPLHGVGTESRLLLRGALTIVARFGVHIVVVTTDGSRSAVVGLARAVGAKVAPAGSPDANPEAP
jgi:hypothetical protein